MGDLDVQKLNLPKPTAEEQLQQTQIRKELTQLTEHYIDLYDRLYGPSRVRTKDEWNKGAMELDEVNRQMSAPEAKLPRPYEAHGWIWLFPRK